MKIALGADHRGYRLKEHLKGAIEELGHTWEDFGTQGDASVDYPDYAVLVASEVAQGSAEVGVLICATGLGMCIAANKVPGIRAAVCWETVSARYARAHNNANILCLGGELTGPGMAVEILKAFLSTEFEGGRHARRVSKIALLEHRPSQD
jgi:ribose 5-phosphate isomerase B